MAAALEEVLRTSCTDLDIHQLSDDLMETLTTDLIAMMMRIVLTFKLEMIAGHGPGSAKGELSSVHSRVRDANRGGAPDEETIWPQVVAAFDLVRLATAPDNFGGGLFAPEGCRRLGLDSNLVETGDRGVRYRVTNDLLLRLLDACVLPGSGQHVRYLSTEGIGDLYQSLRSFSVRREGEQLSFSAGEQRRVSGTHYTPSAVAAEVIASTLDPLLVGAEPRVSRQTRSGATSTNGALDLWVCDISSGCGAFLLQVVRHLERHVRNLDELSAPEDGAELRRTIIERCIYGLDLDALAVDIARICLWTLAGDRTLRYERIAKNIRHGNALCGRPFAAGARLLPPGIESPFDWDVAFPEVIAAGGFDAIVGNPPFGNGIERVHARPLVMRRYFAAQYQPFAAGTYDLYLLFWARAINHLLAAGGRYGLLGPTALLSDLKSWQQWMHEHMRPTHFLLYPVHSFAAARIRTIAVCGQHGKSSVVRVKGEDGSVRRVEWPAPIHCWNEVVSSSPHAPLRLEQLTTLETLPVDLFAGCTVAVAYKLAVAAYDRRDGGSARLITTGLIDRYQCLWGTREARFLSRRSFFPRWPAGTGLPNDVLRARDRQAATKIIIGGLTRVLEAWLDTGAESAGVVSTWIVNPRATFNIGGLYLLLAVINSATFSRIYLQRYGARAMSGRQTTIQKRALLAMPVPACLTAALASSSLASAACRQDRRTSDLMRRIVQRSERLQLSATSDRSWAATDKSVHLSVGRLYGMSDSESLDDYQWWCEASGDRTTAIGRSPSKTGNAGATGT